jgi:hypothetical protein
VKLNFNFDGKTRLKEWWTIVRDNLTSIQELFNSHQSAAELDHPSKSVKQKHIADKAVGQGQLADGAVGTTQIAASAVTSAKIGTAAVNAEHIAKGVVTAEKLSDVVNEKLDEVGTLKTALTTETNKRTAADSDLQSQINKINKQSNTADLYGAPVTHTFKAVLPTEIPAPYFDDDQQYYGQQLTVDMPEVQIFMDGEKIQYTALQIDDTLKVNGDSYFVLYYNLAGKELSILWQSEMPETKVNSENIVVGLYKYENINCEFKVDSNSPTGDRYEFETYGAAYLSDNADTTGNTYTIEASYDRTRTLEDLQSPHNESFLDAANDIESRVETLENGNTITLPIEVTGDTHLDMVDCDEKVYTQKILSLMDSETWTAQADIKVQYENCTSISDSSYPEAKYVNFSHPPKNTEDVYYTDVYAGQKSVNLGGDSYIYDFDTEITSGGIAVFRVTKLASGGADVIYGTLQLLEIVPTVTAPVMYIRTAEDEEYTRIARYTELVAERKKVRDLQSRVTTLEALYEIMKNDLGTMSEMLDTLNGETEDET